MPFLGKGDIRRQTKFCIAPPAVPIKMIVGCEFMEQHPGVLWDQQPPSRKVLLAVQPRMKVRLFFLGRFELEHDVKRMLSN